MTVLNQTLFDFPLTWNRSRFKTMYHKYRIARKLIEYSINVQFEKQMRNGFAQNIEIEHNLNDFDERLSKCQDKLRLLDNMVELASQSLGTYFDKRMERVCAIIKEHCEIIQQVISEEAEHWKDIHAVMNQNLLNPGDIRSCNNNYPRVVQKSPAATIQTIQEEKDDNNSRPVIPIITQSKNLAEVPSIKVHSPDEQDISVCRRDERISMHVLPRNTLRQPFEIIEATFVVKPEDTINDGYANGTYRAVNQQYDAHLTITQPDTLLMDTQPNIPARLCFSPTILQDVSASHNDDESNEQTSSSSSSSNKQNPKPMNIIFPSYQQNRMCFKKFTTDNHRFGQTVLLDIIKTEQANNNENRWNRPIIQEEEDVIFIAEIRPPVPSSKHILDTINNGLVVRTDHPTRQELSSAQEKVPKNSLRRRTAKTKTKSVIVTTRKTRSATKIIAEREAATAKALLEKSVEKKRRGRKRKQSKSIDRLKETSDKENVHKRKTKRLKKSRIDHQESETSDDENDKTLIKNKRTTRKRRHHHHEEVPNNSTNKKRKTEKLQENDISDPIRRKRVKLLIIDSEDKKYKERKRRQKLKKAAKNGDEQRKIRKSTRLSSKRSNRPIKSSS